jgi:radical SAM family uncharacterized protein/radical SAM-linked protein
MEAELRARNLPLVSLESARPLAAFDVVGFSLQYELTFTNVLNMLELGGVPVRSADRTDGDPLVIAGGPVATHPEPLAPFIDVFLIGEAEEKLPDMLRLWADLRDRGLPRRERLIELARTGGLYVPSLYERAADELSGLHVVQPSEIEGVPYPIVKELVDDIDRFPFPDDSPEPVAEAIFDRMSVEIARGCTEGCRFCQAGMIYRPVRERDPDAIVDVLVSAVKKGGYDEASLTSLSTADYSCIAPLIKKVADRLEQEGRISLSVSSLRAYGLSDQTLDDIARVKAGGLTFAPEAGTQRMRDVVNKNVSEQDITDSAHRVFSKGWQRIKLYFMIGLPTETDEDVLGIVETAARVQKVGNFYHSRGLAAVTASASSHVPKPHTPFQWCAMDTVDELRRKQYMLSQAAKRMRIAMKWHDHRTSWLEGIVARGDVRVSDVIETAWKKGARFDGWDEVLQMDAWLEAIAEHGLDPTLYLGTIRVDARLPWDHIDVRLEPGFLAREYRRAVQGRLSPPCGKPAKSIVHHTNLPDAAADSRKLVCYNCGLACDMTAMREDRLTVLEKLGATERPPENRPIEEIRAGGRLKKGPPPRQDQGQSWRYRVTYTKMGTSRLTSHLDLVRSLPRIFRRAGFALKLSEGYSPKPVLSFGPALPLGSFGLEEVLDVLLLEDVDPGELVERLNASSSAGIRFLLARQLEEKEKAVNRVARLAEYMVGTPSGTSADELAEACHGFMEAEHVGVERTRKGKTREVNLRADVSELEVVVPERLAELHPELSHVAGPVVRLVMRLGTENAFRPEMLVARLLGGTDDELTVVRLRLFGEAEGGLVDVLTATEEAKAAA